MPPVAVLEGIKEVMEESRVQGAEVMVEAGMVAVPEEWSLYAALRSDPPEFGHAL